MRNIVALMLLSLSALAQSGPRTITTLSEACNRPDGRNSGTYSEYMVCDVFWATENGTNPCRITAPTMNTYYDLRNYTKIQFSFTVLGRDGTSHLIEFDQERDQVQRSHRQLSSHTISRVRTYSFTTPDSGRYYLHGGMRRRGVSPGVVHIEYQAPGSETRVSLCGLDPAHTL